MTIAIRKPAHVAKSVGLALALVCGLAGNVLAAEHEVRMLNKGEAGNMVFEPATLTIQPGDSVTFVPVDKGHNAETVKDLIPVATEPFKGKINEEITATFDVPGAFLIKCGPHYSMGMAMLIVVGDEAPDLSAIQQAKLPAKVRARLSEAYPSFEVN